ncbi:hypothetical protein HK101_002499 [Irineochytrium annulatum]|nr:hypothetical protein HK101_002499 [Irineochytrium annulatum]
MDSARTQARAIVTNVDRNISALADATSAAIDSLSTSLLPPTHPRSIPVSEPAVPQPDDAFIDPFADPSDDENMNPIRTGPAAAPIRQQSQPAPIQPAVQQQNPLPVQSNPLPLPTLLGNPLVPASIQQSYAKSPFVNAMSAASNSFNKAFVQPGAHKVYPYEVEQERRRMLAAQAGQGGQREGNGQGVRVVYVQGQQVMPVNVQHEEPLPVYRSEKN